MLLESGLVFGSLMWFKGRAALNSTSEFESEEITETTQGFGHTYGRVPSRSNSLSQEHEVGPKAKEDQLSLAKSASQRGLLSAPTDSVDSLALDLSKPQFLVGAGHAT